MKLLNNLCYTKSSQPRRIHSGSVSGCTHRVYCSWTLPGGTCAAGRCRPSASFDACRPGSRSVWEELKAHLARLHVFRSEMFGITFAKNLSSSSNPLNLKCFHPLLPGAPHRVVPRWVRAQVPAPHTAHWAAYFYLESPCTRSHISKPKKIEELSSIRRCQKIQDLPGKADTFLFNSQCSPAPLAPTMPTRLVRPILQLMFLKIMGPSSS